MSKKKKRRKFNKQVIWGGGILAAILLLAVIAVIASHSRKPQEAAGQDEAVSRVIPEKDFTPETGTRGQGYRVCLDAGHGGNDPGTSGGGFTEAEDTLAMTLLIRQCLEAQGCAVVMTRSEDVYLSLEERVDLANAEGVNALVSIHRNTVDDASVNGAEVWINSAEPENARILGSCILSALEMTGVLDTHRGVRAGTSDDPSANYWINRASTMASCIVELGFMSSDADNAAYHDHMGTIAQAVANGILDALADPGFN